MLNRTVQPNSIEIDEIRLPELKEHFLKNGLRLLLINVPGTDILRIEFLFDAGSWYQNKNMVASSVASLLLDGTKQRSEKEIAETIDFYGAFIDLGIDHDNSWLVLYTLTKYLTQSLEIIKDVLVHSSFPEKNFKTYLGKRKQSFIIENKKINNIAKTKFSEALFGTGHPYGNTLVESDFDLIQRDELIAFFKQFYSPASCRVYVSGAIDKHFLNIFSENFGKDNWNKNNPSTAPRYTITTDSNKIHFIKKDDAVQSAIRIGCRVVNQKHPDFIGLQILNTSLGGYFGSRLMKNIREDKGFTYGIGSAVSTLKESGVFFISSEVGNEYCRPAIKEIYFEIEKLKTEIIPEVEFNLVKNYMLGELMRSADGPFQVVEIWQSIIELNLENDYFKNVFHEIKNTEAIHIQRLANKYFQINNLIEVVVGK